MSLKALIETIFVRRAFPRLLGFGDTHLDAAIIVPGTENENLRARSYSKFMTLGPALSGSIAIYRRIAHENRRLGADNLP